MILIVTYELKGPAGEYSEFYEILKKQGRWWHYMASTWLISTDKKPNEVFQELKPHITQNDRVLIADMGNSYQGWLPESAWDWIHREESKQPTLSGLVGPEHLRGALGNPGI